MIGQLTAVRGPLAFWVVLYHFVGKSFAPADLGWAQPVVDRGYLAVDAFFVLSGLIIAHTWARRIDEEPVGAFLWARLTRLHPTHAAVLGLFCVALAVSHALGRALPGDYGAVDLLWQLLLVNAWGVTDGLSWNYPAWSISAEWFAYLLAPGVLLRLVRADARQAAAAVAVALAVLAVGDLGVMPGGLASWTDARALVRITAGFAVGVVIAGRVVPGSGSRPRWLAAGGLLVVAGLAVGWDVVVVAGLALVLAGLYAAPPMAVPSWLLALGAWSYALYLVHALVQVSAQAIVNGADLVPAARLAGLGLALAASVGAAAVLHRLVEQPAQRWLRDRPPTPIIRAARWRSGRGSGDVQVVLVQRVGEAAATGRVEVPGGAELGGPGVEQPPREHVGR